MAWYNRVAKAVGRAIRNVLGGEQPQPPAPPPQAPRQATYEPPYQPVEPSGPIPSAASYGTPEAAMGLPADQPVAQPSPFYETETPAPQVDWTGYGDEFVIYDPATYDPLPTDRLMTKDDWYSEALMPADYLRARYDWADKNIERPNIEILRQLDADDYFIDWDAWRDQYEAEVRG